jgi:hypothetical protein
MHNHHITGRIEEAMKKMRVDPAEKKSCFEASDFSTCIFYENPA